MTDEQHEAHLHMTNILALCTLRGIESDVLELQNSGFAAALMGGLPKFTGDPKEHIAGLVEVAETIVAHIEALDDGEIPGLIQSANVILDRIKAIPSGEK